MPNENKKQPFSRLNSLYLSCRRHLSCSNLSSSSRLVTNPNPIRKKLPLPPQNTKIPNGKQQNESSVEGDLRRVCDLETELEELEEWFCSELTRLKSHLGSTIEINNNNDGSCHFGINTNNGERINNKFERLDFEEGYLYNYNGKKNIDGICRDLSIQVSSPALVPPEPGFTNISEVLTQMEEMGKENLMSWLLESMPMINISTNNTKRSSNINSCTNTNNLFEPILMKSIDKLQDLVIEGLQIQMGTKEMVKWQQVFEQRENNDKARKARVDHVEGNAITVMVLIQPRDLQRGYEPVNEMMIGLIEATNAGISEDVGFMIKGVYVAGLVGTIRNGEAIHNGLWCVSA